MNQDIKPFIIKVGIVAGSIVGVGGLFYATSCYQEYSKVEKHEKNQATIRELIAYCDFNHLTDEENQNLRACGDDVEAVRATLQNIVRSRLIFWKGKLTDASDALDKLRNIKRNANFWNQELENKYQSAEETVKAGGRMAIEQLKIWNGKLEGLNKWKPGTKIDKQNLLMENPPKQSNSNV